jgi:ligand-binding SRPBCC domain-containing protein
MPELRLVTHVRAPVERCFDLSRSIDLHLRSMAASREQAVAGVTTGLIGAGQEVTWEARHFGLRWRATSRIVEFHPPFRFVDEMVRGPFALFRHEHEFQAENGGTRMVDAVAYRSRCGLVTPFADRVAGPYLARLLRLRNDTIRKEAEAC